VIKTLEQKREHYWMLRKKAKQEAQFIVATYYEGIIEGLNEAIRVWTNERI